MSPKTSFKDRYGLISRTYKVIPIGMFFKESKTQDAMEQKGIKVLDDFLSLNESDFEDCKWILPSTKEYLKDLNKDEHNKKLEVLFNVDTEKIIDSNLNDTDLSIRSKNGLMRKGKKTIKDMLSMTKNELLTTRNLGQKCLFEIFDFIDKIPKDENSTIHSIEINNNEIINEYKNILEKLSSNRKKAKVEHYKNLYKKQINDKDIENNFFANLSLEELVNELIEKNQGLYRYRDFINWCSRNILCEIESVIDSVLPNERDRNVVLLRSKAKTLEEIGQEYGITRERIRQIESNALRRITPKMNTDVLLFLIGIECNEYQIISTKQINEFLKEIKDYSQIFIFISKNKKGRIRYNPEFDCFEFGNEFDFSKKGKELAKIMPDQFHKNEYNTLKKEVMEKYGVYENAFNIYVEKKYNRTNDLFHKGQISARKVIVPILEKYYQDGIKVYDQSELSIFRALVEKEIGPGLLPENDRSLTAAIERVCVLCDRGKYKLQTDEYISNELKAKIWDHIKKHECPIIMTESILDTFREELNEFGIDNYNHLQGILHHLYGNKLIYKKSYVSKDKRHRSLTKDIYDFIKNSKYPIDKKEIRERYPFVTEIVIATAVTVPSILNYQGKYMHVSNIKLSKSELNYFKKIIDDHLSQNDYVNCRTIFEEVEKSNKELLLKCSVFYQSALFSVLDYFLSNDYQFTRPYIAKEGVDVGHPYERIAELVREYERIEISKIFEFIKNNRIVNPQVECINSTNETHLIADENWLVSIDELGITEEIAQSVEEIILKYISETCPIYTLQCFFEFPKINGKWTDWLVFSLLTKWGRNVDIALNSTTFKSSYPLISPKGKMNAEKYRQIPKDVTIASMKYNDIDDMLIESLEEEWMESDEF